MNLLPLAITGVLALFGGAAAAALINGLFTRPKIRAEASAAVTTALAASASAAAASAASDATAAKAIQEAAAGLVIGIQEELNRLREQCAANERRLSAADRWREGAEELLAAHGRWGLAVVDLLSRHSIDAPPPPPLTPSPRSPHPGR